MEGGLEQSIQEKYRLLAELFDERERRLWAAVEAQQLGRGGISAVAKATGLSRTMIYQGLNELSECAAGAGLRRDRIRAEGDTRQDARSDSREAKVDCRQADQQSNPECRQDKRDAKQEGRESARDIKY